MGYVALVLVLVVLVNFSLPSPLKKLARDVSKNECLENCSRTEKNYINVHIIPFSQDESSLSYSDLFYYLGQNASRKFVLSETSFFWNWYTVQGGDLQNSVLEFFENGQIQFVNGAWTTNNHKETSNYQSIIDQYSWGLRQLNDTVGSCALPKIALHLDGFKEAPPPFSFFPSFEYDGEISKKIGYVSSDRIEENNTRNSLLEIRWKGNNLRGVMTDLFLSATSISQNNFLSHFEYIMLEEGSTKHVLIPVPFYEWDIQQKFEHIEYLISSLQDHPKYHLLFSTPLCYIKSVYQENLENNYFNTEKANWYSAFPNLKRHEQLENNFLQICKQLAATAHIQNVSRINTLREAMALVERSENDNHTESVLPRKLYQGYSQCHDVVNDALKKLTRDLITNYTNCMLLANTTECPFTLEHEDFVVTVYNPLSRPRTKMIRLPVKDTDKDYAVRSSDGTNRPYQLVPIPEGLLRIPGRNDSAKYKLLFRSPDVPALGFRSFYVEKTNDSLPEGVGLEHYNTDDMFFVTPNVNFSISKTTGLLESMNVGHIKLNVSQEFCFYNMSSETLNTSINFFSIFGAGQTKPTFKIYKGKIATEVHQVFNDWLSQVIRVYHSEDGIEFESIVGPIPDNFPRELDIISRWTTDLKTNMKFYTDENGLNTITRISQPVDSKERLASNYYPVSAKIAIKDENRNTELMVLVDKPTGGSSLRDGEIEIILLRGADAKPGEMIQALTFVIPGPIHSKDGELTVDARSVEMVNKKLLDAWNSVSSTKELSYEEYREAHTMEFAGMAKPLPRNAQIMTLEPWTNSSLLLRLQHLFPEGADPILSQPVTVDLKGLFRTFEITAIRETTLGANRFKELSEPEGGVDEFGKVLEPGEIRTFIIDIEDIQITGGASLRSFNLFLVVVIYSAFLILTHINQDISSTATI